MSEPLQALRRNYLSTINSQLNSSDKRREVISFYSRVAFVRYLALGLARTKVALSVRTHSSHSPFSAGDAIGDNRVVSGISRGRRPKAHKAMHAVRVEQVLWGFSW